jgi:hypothetical protein
MYWQMTGFYKPIVNIVSLFICLLLAFGGFTACSIQKTQNTEFTDTFSTDNYISTDDTVKVETEFHSSLASFDGGGTTFYADEYFVTDFEDYIFDKYSEYIDGVYVTVLTPEEYKNALLVLNSGKQLNINKIVRDVFIGTGSIVVTSILLPALAPGLAPRMAIIITNIVRDAMLGAAFDAGISGVIEYVKSGDTKAALYKALEGGAEGFKWGAIISSATNSFAEIRLLKQSQQIDDTLVNFSENTNESRRGLTNSADDIANKTDQWAHFDGGVLKPNQKYLFGNPPHSNIYIGYTDDLGRIIRVEAPNLQLKPQGRLKLQNNRNTPGKQPGDEAGHILGDQFDGSPYLDNLVSMSYTVNHGVYYRLETEWANALKAGKEVRVYIDIDYAAGSLRPSSFHVEYEIDGEFFEKTILNIVEKING